MPPTATQPNGGSPISGVQQSGSWSNAARTSPLAAPSAKARIVSAMAPHRPRGRDIPPLVEWAARQEAPRSSPGQGVHSLDGWNRRTPAAIAADVNTVGEPDEGNLMSCVMTTQDGGDADCRRRLTA